MDSVRNRHAAKRKKTEEDKKVGIAAKLWAAASDSKASDVENPNSATICYLDEAENVCKQEVTDTEDSGFKIGEVFSLPLESYLHQEAATDKGESVEEILDAKGKTAYLSQVKCKPSSVVLQRIDRYLKGKKCLRYKYYRKKFNRCGKSCRITHVRNKSKPVEQLMKEEQDKLIGNVKKHGTSKVNFTFHNYHDFELERYFSNDKSISNKTNAATIKESDVPSGSSSFNNDTVDVNVKDTAKSKDMSKSQRKQRNVLKFKEVEIGKHIHSSKSNSKSRQLVKENKNSSKSRNKEKEFESDEAELVKDMYSTNSKSKTRKGGKLKIPAIPEVSNKYTPDETEKFTAKEIKKKEQINDKSNIQVPLPDLNEIPVTARISGVPKSLPMVGNTRNATQSSDISKESQGQFMLINVDGKNILVPTKLDEPNPKAYIINESNGSVIQQNVQPIKVSFQQQQSQQLVRFAYPPAVTRSVQSVPNTQSFKSSIQSVQSMSNTQSTQSLAYTQVIPPVQQNLGNLQLRPTNVPVYSVPSLAYTPVMSPSQSNIGNVQLRPTTVTESVQRPNTGPPLYLVGNTLMKPHVTNEVRSIGNQLVKSPVAPSLVGQTGGVYFTQSALNIPSIIQPTNIQTKLVSDNVAGSLVYQPIANTSTNYVYVQPNTIIPFSTLGQQTLLLQQFQGPKTQNVLPGVPQGQFANIPVACPNLVEGTNNTVQPKLNFVTSKSNNDGEQSTSIHSKTEVHVPKKQRQGLVSPLISQNTKQMCFQSKSNTLSLAGSTSLDVFCENKARTTLAQEPINSVCNSGIARNTQVPPIEGSVISDLSVSSVQNDSTNARDSKTFISPTQFAPIIDDNNKTLQPSDSKPLKVNKRKSRPPVRSDFVNIDMDEGDSLDQDYSIFVIPKTPDGSKTCFRNSTNEEKKVTISSSDFDPHHEDLHMKRMTESQTNK